MADKYKHLKRKARAERRKKKSCSSKKAYETKEEAYQKGQTFYKCKHCGKFHRSGKMTTFIRELEKKSIKFRKNG